ncbi:MAG: hypothetical protein ACRDE7_14120, partial [Sphingobacterium sp.]
RCMVIGPGSLSLSRNVHTFKKSTVHNWQVGYKKPVSGILHLFIPAILKLRFESIIDSEVKLLQ